MKIFFTFFLTLFLLTPASGQTPPSGAPTIADIKIPCFNITDFQDTVKKNGYTFISLSVDSGSTEEFPVFIVTFVNFQKKMSIVGAHLVKQERVCILTTGNNLTLGGRES